MMIDGVESTSYDYTLPMMIFAGFGVLSIVFALLLRRGPQRLRSGAAQYRRAFRGLIRGLLI
ncbi:MAG: hypothetical protein ACLT1W_14840 [Alistipes onderdonkii]